MDTQSYQNAKELLKAQDYRAAERAFKKVLDSIDEHDRQYHTVQSYYGLAQVLNGEENGLLLCRDAAGSEVADGQVFLNLACAELHSDNRKRAVEAIQHGMKVDADNPVLKGACAKLDCRTRCCFNFLPRGHAINRFFGRLRRRPVPEVTVHDLLFL